jgi:alkyldihydroxyacetonephosphate synthase
MKYDLAIIGGGTVGSMIFFDATLRGLSCVLIEKGEVGMQTNYSALGFLQPGLNYINKDRKFLHDNAIDCGLFAEIAPDFLINQEFIIPVFPHSKHSVRTWDGATSAYDRSSKLALQTPHQKLLKAAILKKEGLLRNSVKGGILYNEWIINPHQLTNALVNLAAASGGEIKKQTEATSHFLSALKNTKKVHSILINNESQVEEIEASVFINAAGPWAPKVLKEVFKISAFPTRMTRGTSVIVKARFTKLGFILFDETDKYIVVLPTDKNHTIIGPTNCDIESEVSNDPDKLRYEEWEIENLFKVVSQHFHINLGKDLITEIKCGLRPQLEHLNVIPNKISHKFIVIDHEKREKISNLITVFGGKISNQIRMAKETVDLACEKLGEKRLWIVPNFQITKEGLKEFTASKDYHSLYQHKLALSHENDIGRVALIQKAKTISFLAPFVAGAFLKTEFFKKRREVIKLSNKRLIDKLANIFGEAYVKTDKAILLEYSFDKCPRNLLRRSSSSIAFAMVVPTKENYKSQIPKLISLAKKYGKKLVIRGGGSGVCGAAVPRQGHETIIIDMTHVNDMVIDKDRNFVTVGAGILGGEIEAKLNQIGFTLGHSPASLDISTPGGWVATRSNGQFSFRYGTIEEMTLSIEAVNDNGKIQNFEDHDLKKFFRMEGTTGIITKVTLKIFPIPRHRAFRCYSFKNMRQVLTSLDALNFLRDQLEPNDVFISAIRIFDLMDYKFVAKPYKSKSSSGNKESVTHSFKHKFEKMLATYSTISDPLLGVLKKIKGGAFFLLVTLESDNPEVLEGESLEVDIKMIEEIGGSRKDDSIAETWYENRFKLSYDKLVGYFERGMIVDTFDCQAKNLPSVEKIYYAVKNSIKDHATVCAHFGCDRNNYYLYFTIAAVGGIEKYDLLWQKMLKACHETGGLTVHHHGIGFLKAGTNNEFIQHGYGKEWFKNARKEKQKMDPEGIFNPRNIF